MASGRQELLSNDFGSFLRQIASDCSRCLRESLEKVLANMDLLEGSAVELSVLLNPDD